MTYWVIKNNYTGLINYYRDHWMMNGKAYEVTFTKDRDESHHFDDVKDAWHVVHELDDVDNELGDYSVFRVGPKPKLPKDGMIGLTPEMLTPVFNRNADEIYLEKVQKLVDEGCLFIEKDDLASIEEVLEMAWKYHEGQ